MCKENVMKYPTIVALAIAGLACSVYAADAPKEPTKPQSRMAACNQEAGDKKGVERKAFMRECLTDKKARQQEKMKTCNADAKGKQGVERRTFMKECLSK
jgi:hypothetical protein